MIGRSLASTLAVLLTASCATNNFPRSPDPPGPSMIRLHNASRYRLETVSAHFQNQIVDYGTLEPGQLSDYRSADRAFRYTYLEAMVGGEKLILQPIDFMGEVPLGIGYFTYHVTVNEGARGLWVETGRDQ